MLKSNYFPRANASAIALCFYVIALTATAQAQTPSAQRPTDAPPVTASPTPSPSPAATTATDRHDLSITANVTARELLFEVVPNPKVEFPGQPRRDTVWEAERTNLPPQVQPGVTYRDIGIRLKITSVFADIERIVAEALGEISASDDNNNTPQTPEMNASDAPQVDHSPSAPQVNHAPSATLDATQTNATPQAASLTQTSRAASAAAKPTPTRKNNSHAPTRRGRP